MYAHGSIVVTPRYNISDLPVQLYMLKVALCILTGWISFCNYVDYGSIVHSTNRYNMLDLLVNWHMIKVALFIKTGILGWTYLYIDVHQGYKFYHNTKPLAPLGCFVKINCPLKTLKTKNMLDKIYASYNWSKNNWYSKLANRYLFSSWIVSLLKMMCRVNPKSASIINILKSCCLK